MLYAVGNTVNTFRLVEFDHRSSTDHMTFQEGRSLSNDAVVLKYSVAKKSAYDRLRRIHFVESTGPQLASSRLREALQEEESRGEVEFFDVEIESEHGTLDDLFAMNVTHRVACTDMSRSEAEQTNFDPENPSYDFDYQVLSSEFDSDLRIATCDEMLLLTVIDETLLARFSRANLTGLVFSSAIDMTPLERSIRVKL